MPRPLVYVFLVAGGLLFTQVHCTPPSGEEIGIDGGINTDTRNGSSDASTRNDGVSTLPDGMVPDATAEDDSYLVSNQSGTAAAVGTGARPQGDPSSPVHVDPFNGNTTFIPGGTNRFSGGVVGGAATGLVVGFAELSDHFSVELPNANFTFFVTLGQSVRRASLTLVVIPILPYSESNPMGGYGQELRIPCTVQQVGTGELQISLSWSTETDVDLHLIEPGGEEIYYRNDVSNAGGELDLDSNADCNIDHVNNENITYQNVTPPSGHYRVLVDYWSACQEYGNTDFVVTVTVRGEAQVYQGSFVRSDEDGGGEGDGRLIAEFDF